MVGLQTDKTRSDSAKISSLLYLNYNQFVKF